MKPSTDDNESHRLATLVACRLDGEIEEDPVLRRIVEIVAKVFDVPIALISVIQAERQYFAAKVGLEGESGPRDASFCTHAIKELEPFIVPDTTADGRFAENPYVVGEPFVRFYAGIPVFAANGMAVGTVCIIDQRPRVLDSGEQGTLTNFARIVEEHLQVRSRADLLVEGEDHQVIGGAVHDLKGPLTAIDGISQVLREMPELIYDDPSIVDDLSSSVSRLRYQLYDLLDMMVSRKTASFESLVLDEVVERAVRELAHRASRMGRQLEVVGIPSNVQLKGNRSLLSRCLYNLIDNALKYSPHGEPVTVTVERKEQEARIAVSDRGDGIPAEMRERVFEPGLRLHGERSGSAGLGLSSAKRAAEAHHGTLRLSTETEQGTTFELLLPLEPV